MPHETVLISAPELLIPVLLRRRLCCKLNIVTTAFMLVALSILLRSLVFHHRLRGLTFSSPAFSSPVRWSRVFQSCVFHPCILVPSFPVPRFQRLQSRYGYSQPRAFWFYISSFMPAALVAYHGRMYATRLEVCGSNLTCVIFFNFFFSFYCLFFIVVCDLFSLTYILIDNLQNSLYMRL